MADKYLLHGKLVAKAGQQDELAAILLEAATLMSAAKGCRVYVVGKDEKEPNAVYVTEVWDSREDHDNSLNVDGVKELIMRAMPVLEGPPQKGQEIRLLGGWGV
ncbi:MAG: antibiotic biosynthesis monooxygenase family protein [Niabella sp.]